MQFYKKKKTGKTWQKNPVVSFLHLFRDGLIFLLPIKRLPSFLIKPLYGVKPKFIFFVHPRRTEDVYVAMPFLVPLRRILGRALFEKILYFCPPFVLNTIKTERSIDGAVIGTLSLPKVLLKSKKTAIRESVRGLFFGSKITPRGAVLGLGGLWPMVTRRGLSLTQYAKPRGTVVTNGHCGTLVSLFLTIKKLADLANIPMDELKIVILGVGKMGTNLARALYGKVATLTLVDINETTLNRVEEKLKQTIAITDIQKYTNREDVEGIEKILSNSHITVCTTSNATRILRPEQIPGNTIIIDDSRPEGIPRSLGKENIAILEGGILKIKGIRQNYDFGFGVDENVFGCLAESFLLAAIKDGSLAPTLGEVDFKNFDQMILACKKVDVTIEEFKCRDEIIKPERLISILRAKTDLRSTIPFKNICWLLKVDDMQNL